MPPFGTWLAEIGLGRYDQVFAANEIDFDVIRSLTDADLRELGLALGDRKRLLQAVARLDEQPADTSTQSVAPAAASETGSRRCGFAQWRTSPAHRDVLRPGGFDGAE